MIMTTPRDDIAGLSERLRYTAVMGVPDFTNSQLLNEAATEIDAQAAEISTLRAALYDETEGISAACNATQLDSLLKERDALQARVKELESGIAHAQYSSDNCDAENQSLYNRLEAVESRALRAEQERDSLKVDCSAYASRNTNLINDLVLAGLARDAAEQERDEAHERLKPFAKGWWSHQNPNVKISAIFNHNPFDERVLCTVGEMQAAYSLVRRLAGPEKEKKE